MNEAEMARQKTIRFEERMKKKKEKQAKRDKKDIIKTIDRHIRKAIRNGEYSTLITCDTVKYINEKNFIKEYYTSKGYSVDIPGHVFIYMSIFISWDME